MLDHTVWGEHSSVRATLYMATLAATRYNSVIQAGQSTPSKFDDIGGISWAGLVV